jgi:hypothetical protein
LIVGKSLISIEGSIGDLFFLSRDIRHRKTVAGDVVGKGSGVRPLEKLTHLVVDLAVVQTFCGVIRASKFS